MTFNIERVYFRQAFRGSHCLKIFCKGVVIMLYVGINVAKDKHDCFAMTSDGEILIDT